MERCELSDLPVDQCACHVHAPTEPPTMSQRIDGRIEDCDETFVSGERICNIEHLGYVHEDCAWANYRQRYVLGVTSDGA
jgi:hypothetical protein